MPPIFERDALVAVMLTLVLTFTFLFQIQSETTCPYVFQLTLCFARFQSERVHLSLQGRRGFSFAGKTVNGIVKIGMFDL